MKKLLFGLIATVMSVLNVEANTFNKTHEKCKFENINSLKRIKVDTWVKDTKGQSWHVTGWVDVSIGFSGVSISDYDITLTGNGHSYHFQGKVKRTQLKNGEIENVIDGTLIENDKTLEITEDIKSILINCNEEIMKNQ
jgi:hypothetical protein